MPATGRPRALVVRTAGTNCDAEMVRAFRLAGCTVDLLHVDRLAGDPAPIDRADLIGFPGGFSYGDDIASGRILAARLRETLWPSLREAAARGCPMIGVCNGFQVLVQVGLLPGPPLGEPWPTDTPPPQTVALAANEGGRFIDRWVGVEPVGDRCIWTRGLTRLEHTPGGLMLPIAHGEGRFVVRDDATLDALDAGGHVALRYTEPVNGSRDDIAGICDATGRIFGLMPHPERALDHNRHPAWTRARQSRHPTPGMQMFRSAVEAVRASPV
ncbi:MAG TPA: phosphoribosylformylglycinamidine synthase subunit PurQ [Phycisphaerales bacterium]|nr:phosphoribosylformylglycinamidine synthase subunit PurQ [Phycisphaerales bacterium]